MLLTRMGLKSSGDLLWRNRLLLFDCIVLFVFDAASRGKERPQHGERGPQAEKSRQQDGDAHKWLGSPRQRR